MSERENSVLFSLKELRSIEEDRVKQEKEEEQGRIDAARRAEEAKIAAAKAEEERKVREEQDRLARHEQEKERQIREEQLRLEESERKARIEAQSRIEEARIQAEIAAKAQAANKKAPVGLILGAVGGVLALAGAALAYVFLVVMPHREAEQAMRAQAEQDRAVAAAVAKAQSDLSDDYNKRIAATQDAAEKARLEAELAAKKQAAANAIVETAHKSHPRPVQAGNDTKPKPTKPAGPKCDPDKDPLCGL